MRVSNVKRIVRLLLIPLLILYALLNILVDFRRYINGNEFVKQTGDSTEINESVIFDKQDPFHYASLELYVLTTTK